MAKCELCGEENATEREVAPGVFEVQCPDCGGIYEVDE